MQQAGIRGLTTSLNSAGKYMYKVRALSHTPYAAVLSSPNQKSPEAVVDHLIVGGGTAPNMLLSV